MLHPDTRNNFIPASRYYGDKFARTMDEAFGPGAKLTTGPEDAGDVKSYALVGLGVVIGVGMAMWAVGIS